MAYDPKEDQDLVRLDARHLFALSTTRIGFRRNTFLRTYMYDFIELFAPHLTPREVQAAEQMGSQEEVDVLFDNLELPVY